MKMAQWGPMRQRYVYAWKMKLQMKELLIIDELKAFKICNERKEYPLFKKVDPRKLRDVTKKVNAVVRHIETDNLTQTNKIALVAAL